MQRYDRLHVLINNAAQTLTRPAGWRGRMDDVDAHAAQALKKGSGGTQVRVRKGPARSVDPNPLTQFVDRCRPAAGPCIGVETGVGQRGGWGWCWLAAGAGVAVEHGPVAGART
jgi:hypothetical protein